MKFIRLFLKCHSFLTSLEEKIEVVLYKYPSIVFKEQKI